MNKKWLSIIMVFMVLSLFLSGCTKLSSILKRNEEVADIEVKRETFLNVYDNLEKEIKKKADDCLLTGAIMMKPANEPWDGKSSAWSAGFYSQKNKKAYIIVWNKGTINITKETTPDASIKDKVITQEVAVDSSDALEIAKATMISQIDNTKAESFKSLILAYSNSLKKHVWAVTFEGNHRVLVDAITGEVLEAK